MEEPFRRLALVDGAFVLEEPPTEPEREYYGRFSSFEDCPLTKVCMGWYLTVWRRSDNALIAQVWRSETLPLTAEERTDRYSEATVAAEAKAKELVDRLNRELSAKQN